jgi:hypothetical protein
MKFRLRGVIALNLVLNVFAASVVPGIVVEHEEDALHSRAPTDDPGWANVGVCSGWTAVYLGRGWVLTAAHVGPSNINLEGTLYKADIDSRERVRNPDGTAADLMLFRIDPEPDLPSLRISAESPPIGSPIVMVGRGLGRGEKTTRGGRAGFSWQGPPIKRWGTGMLHEYLYDLSVGNTDAFATRFSIAKTAHEAHAAHGDSGGAAFAYLEDRWQLVGIILAVDAHFADADTDESAQLAAYGDRTLIADLARYRQFIQGVTGVLPD